MLHIAERFELAKMGHNSPDHVDVLAGAMRWAVHDRVLYLDDPAFSLSKRKNCCLTSGPTQLARL